MTFTHALSTNNYGPLKFIVATSPANGTHTTLASALTSASSGDTIYLRDSVTEDVTLKAGVNITSMPSNSSETGSSSVSITGKLTFTAAGTVNISGIQINTNSDFFLAVTGSAASVVNLDGCYLNCSNSTGISFTAANTSARINVYTCDGNLGTTGIAFLSHSSTGLFSATKGVISNSGGSSTANTCSAGSVSLTNSFFGNPFTFSGTGKITAKYSEIDSGATNSTALTTVAGQTNELDYVRLSSGTATPLSVGGTVTATALLLHHTNSVAVTGAGVFVYAGVFQDSTVGTISAGTNTGKSIDAGSISFNGEANALSNYTVGDWTPTFTGSSANPTSVTYSVQVGKYIRIGALVFVHCTLTASAVTLGAAAGNLQISGLPFTAKNTTNYTPIWPVQVQTYDMQAATKFVTAQVQPNSLNVAFIESVDNGAATVTAVTILAANTQVRFTGCYET